MTAAPPTASPTTAPPTTAVLIGPASVDRFVDTGETAPGGGALNMAYHWSQLGKPFTLVSRIARSDETLFSPFFRRHSIATTSAAFEDGVSCSVDVVIQPDRQPWMDNFVEGVWSDFTFTDDEIALIAAGSPTHLVLVDVVDRELLRVADAGHLANARLTGDFLSFRHFDLSRFAATFEHLEVGFIGWPGDLDHPLVDRLGATTAAFGNVLVVTFGSAGVAAFDGRPGTTERHWFDIDAVAVTGTTIGCGDAFIAAYLADWHEHGDITAAVTAGSFLGAAATIWERALPAAAYETD